MVQQNVSSSAKSGYIRTWLQVEFKTLSNKNTDDHLKTVCLATNGPTDKSNGKSLRLK
jgi:hypothetical protein